MQIRKRFSLNLILRGTSILLVGLTPLLLGKWSGSRGYGEYAYFYNLSWVVASIVVLGLDLLAMREVAGAIAVRNKIQATAVIFFSHVLQGLSLAGFGILSMLGLWLLENKIFGGLWDIPWVVEFVLRHRYAFLFAVSSLSLIKLWEGLVIGLGEFVWAQVPRLLVLPGWVLVGGFVFHQMGLDLGSSKLLGLFMVSLSLAFVLLGGVLVYKSKEWWKGVSLSVGKDFGLKLISDSPRFLKSIGAFAIFGVLSIANERVGVILAGSVLSASAAGIYDLISQMARLVAFPLVVTHAIVGPSFSALYRQWKRGDLQSRHELDHLVKQTVYLTRFGGIILTVVLWVLGSRILAFVGEDFMAGLTAFRILLLGQTFNALVGPVALLLNMTENEHYVVRGMTLAIGVSVGLGLWMGSLYGIEGIAIAGAISLFVWNIYLARKVSKQLGLSTLLSVKGRNTWR